MRIYGTHPVEELLAHAGNSVAAIYVDDRDRLADFPDLPDVRVETVDDEELDRLSEGGNHQGILVETTPFQYAPIDDILDATADKPNACVLLLDQVHDPQNFGAILRTAAGLEVDAVVITKDRACPVTHAVVRASAGLAFRVPIACVTNLSRTLEQFKEAGWWSVATVTDGDTELWDMDFDMKTALVMGGEHEGIRRLVRETCDFQTRIPMNPGVESLNVSVATAICTYEIRRQQH